MLSTLMLLLMLMPVQSQIQEQFETAEPADAVGTQSTRNGLLDRHSVPWVALLCVLAPVRGRIELL